MLTHSHFNVTAITIGSTLGFSVLLKFYMQTVGSRDLEKTAIYNDAAIVKPQCYSMFPAIQKENSKNIALIVESIVPCFRSTNVLGI